MFPDLFLRGAESSSGDSGPAEVPPHSLDLNETADRSIEGVVHTLPLVLEKVPFLSIILKRRHEAGGHDARGLRSGRGGGVGPPLAPTGVRRDQAVQGPGAAAALAQDVAAVCFGFVRGLWLRPN